MTNQIRGYINLESYESYLTYEFCIKNFELICKIIEEIEMAICKKYEEVGPFLKR